MNGGNAGARSDVLTAGATDQRVRFWNSRAFVMTQRFKVGDHVSWNSEAGRVRGKIVRVHTTDVNYKGYVHHASKEEPQYEIKSDKTAHIALHNGRALRRLR
jgi:Hypervirulence associated proteins TUDOR domain